MIQDPVAFDYKYKLFIETVVNTGLVWGLQNEDGWAASYSNEYEDVEVLPFWSHSAYAKACSSNDWENYKPASIPLAEFLENWCLGMANDDTLAGINWDSNMFGKEVDTIELALEVSQYLISQGKTIDFLKYDTIGHFIEAIRHVL